MIDRQIQYTQSVPCIIPGCRYEIGDFLNSDNAKTLNILSVIIRKTVQI